MSRARIICWLALGLVFFGSAAFAASYFPKAYDWQHVVISSLASPRDNPRAYLIECAGLAASGLLLLPFAEWMGQRAFAPRTTTLAGVLFRLGAVTLTLSAIIVPGHYRVLGIGRPHEHLAQIAGTSFCLALLLYVVAILRMPSSHCWLKATVIGIAALPIMAFATNRLTLLTVWVFSSEGNYRAMKASYWSSLALWEWVAAASIYLFLGLTVLGDLFEVRRS